MQDSGRKAMVLVVALLLVANTMATIGTVAQGEEDEGLEEPGNVTVIYIIVDDSEPYTVEDLSVDGDLRLVIIEVYGRHGAQIHIRNLTVRGTLYIYHYVTPGQESPGASGSIVFESPGSEGGGDTSEGSNIVSVYYENINTSILKISISDSNVDALAAFTDSNIEIAGSVIDDTVIAGFRSVRISNSRIGGFTITTFSPFTSGPGISRPVNITVESSTIMCGPEAAQRESSILLWDPWVAPNSVAFRNVVFGCNREASLGLTAYIHGNLHIINATYNLSELNLNFYNLRGEAVIQESRLPPTIQLIGKPESGLATVRIEGSRLEPAPRANATEPQRGGPKTTFKVEDAYLYIKGSVISVGELTGRLEGLSVNGSVLRAGAVDLAVHGEIVISNSIIAGSRFEASISGNSTWPSGVVVEGSTLNLALPMRIIAYDNMTVEVYDTRITGPTGGLAVRLENTTVALYVEGLVVQSTRASIIMYALPPSTGRGTIRITGSYFGSPLGPTVLINGTIIRSGGATVALSGAPGMVLVEDWLPSPGFYPVREYNGRVPSVESAHAHMVVPVEVKVDGSWVVGVMLVYNGSVIEDNVTIGGGILLGVLAPAGEGSAEELEGAFGYRIRYPSYSSYAILLLEPVEAESPEEERPAATTTSHTTITTETVAERLEQGKGEGPPLDLVLASAALVAALIYAAYLMYVRGRR